MVILNKTIDNISELNNIIPNTPACGGLYQDMKHIISSCIGDNALETRLTYQHLVTYALDTCMRNIPNPFSSSSAYYGLNLGDDYFTLRYPNKTAFGIKVVPIKGNIKYEVSLVFYNNTCFIESSDDYKDLLSNGWSAKEK